MRFRVAEIIANGGIPGPNMWWGAAGKDYYKSMVDYFRVRQPWTVKATSHKWAAMVASEDTRIFYGQLQPREKYLLHCLGAFRAVQEDHLPLDIITDLDLEEGGGRLSAYKVILLPNTACLSDKAIENLRAYVSKGGGLVATHETSLYDRDGIRRPDFGLADVFKAAYKAEEDHISVWPNLTEGALGAGSMQYLEHPILDDPLISGCFAESAVATAKINRATDFMGKAVNVEAKPEAQVIVLRGGTTSDVQWPALMVSTYGKGRVAYFPNAMDESYFRFPMRFQRRLITNAMRWVASEPSPIEVEAPSCVSVTCYEQRPAGGSRVVVHLLNEIDTMKGKSLTSGTPPMREEMLPISGIKVRFRDRSITGVKLQPEGKKLAVKNKGDYLEVIVPTLEMHSMVVAERNER